LGTDSWKACLFVSLDSSCYVHELCSGYVNKFIYYSNRVVNSVSDQVEYK